MELLSAINTKGTRTCRTVATNTDDDSKYTVCVEGNIGCGKTTLVDYLATLQDVEVVREPVPLWTNLRGHNLLDKMLRDPDRWCMTLENYIYLTHLNIHSTPQTQAVRILERSVHSAHLCFVRYYLDNGHLTALEHCVLDEWYKWILKAHAQHVHVDLYVYLYTKPEISYERMLKRDRGEDKVIPLKRLESLHVLHEDWLKHNRGPGDPPVLIIDANGDVDSVLQQCRDNMDVILGRKKPSHSLS